MSFTSQFSLEFKSEIAIFQPSGAFSMTLSSLTPEIASYLLYDSRCLSG